MNDVTYFTSPGDALLHIHLHFLSHAWVDREGGKNVICASETIHSCSYMLGKHSLFANLNSSVLFLQLMLRSSKHEDGLNVPIPLCLINLNVPKLACCGGGVRARDSNSTFQLLTKVCFNTFQGTCRSQVSPVLRWNEVVSNNLNKKWNMIICSTFINPKNGRRDIFHFFFIFFFPDMYLHADSKARYQTHPNTLCDLHKFGFWHYCSN